MTTTRDQRVRMMLPTVAGRCLWISGTLDHAGQVEQVEISEGWSEGPVDHRRVVQLPGHILPQLREALERLEVEVGEHVCRTG